jgi:2-polyprenyl-3-methyl-5-hydroxy-6-metoxy-1,4-benzoquinol methylase
MDIIRKILNQPKKVRPKKIYLYKNLRDIFQQLPHVKKCLDIGSGKGDLYPQIKCDKYTGIDIDKEFLNYAKKKFPNADFRYKNFKNIEINKYKADLIVCIQVVGFNENFDLNFKNNLKKFFTKLENVTNKNGYIVLSLTENIFLSIKNQKFLEKFNEIKSIKYSSINYRVPYFLALFISKVMTFFPNLLFFKLNYIKVLKKIN